MNPTQKLTPSIIITGHANADFDAIGAMVAATKLYPGAVMVYPGTKERAVQSFFMQGASMLFDFHLPKEVDFSNVKTLVAVDTRQKSRLEHVGEVFKNPELEIHCFDHHPDSEEDLPASFSCVKEWGSTVTLLTHMLMERGIALDRNEATLLGLGIYEDTGFLSFPATTEEDFIAAGWLRRQGMDLNVVSEVMQQNMTPEQVAILHTMLESATVHEINGITIVMMDVSLESFVGDFAAVVQQAMQMTRAKVIFALATMGDRVQLVARSRIEEVDTSRICASFGGGGHPGASSASIKNKTISQVKDALFGLLYSHINPEIKVSNIMSSPVHFIWEDHTIAEAEDIMLGYSLKAMPVLSPETKECTGLIEHQLAARALVHGLGDVPISEYMTRGITTVSSDTSLYSVMEVVMDQQQTLLPVIDNAELVGVVSRTDVLQTLLEDAARIPESISPESVKDRDINALLKEELPDEHFELLKLAGCLGDELKVNVYAVGGFVRDILLQQPTFDLDIVVEGDGIKFAEVLAERLNGRVRSHPDFKTAVVIFKNAAGESLRIDVATARLEYYKHPAALPTVELSSIKMDLYRRDFTINALALHLNGDKFGVLVDFFGAQRDIKDQTVRVLHALSFIEDPTRILRAVRFEQRFGFHLSNQTERLIKNAMRLNVFEKLSGHRIFHELQLITEESAPLLAFQRLEQLKLLEAIHPMLRLTASKENVLQNLAKILSWYDLSYFAPKPQTWVCYLLAFCAKGKYLDVSSLLERLDFIDSSRKDFLLLRENMAAALKVLDKWQQETHSASALNTLLAPLTLEALLFMMAMTPTEVARRPIVDFITRIKDTKVDINGEDLVALGGVPGPAFGLVLKKVLEAKLDGQAVSRTAQLNLARELLEEAQKNFRN